MADKSGNAKDHANICLSAVNRRTPLFLRDSP